MTPPAPWSALSINICISCSFAAASLRFSAICSQLEYWYLPGSAKTVSELSPMDEHAETALVTNTMASTACLPGHLAILSSISGTNPLPVKPPTSATPCMAAEYAVIVGPEGASPPEDDPTEQIPPTVPPTHCS